MASKKTMKRIHNAVSRLMTVNALDKMIDVTQNINELESQRKFIYIEFINTKPVIAYAFNSNETLTIGRSVDACNIVINDETVSRQQCNIRVYGNDIYVQDMGATNPSYIKTGSGKMEMYANECVPIYQTDELIIAGIKIRVLLVQGLDMIVN